MTRLKAVSPFAAAMIALLATGTVLATNFGGPRDSGKHCNDDPVVSQCLADSSYHTVYIEASVDAEIVEEIQWVLANYTAVTDVDMATTTSTIPSNEVAD